MEMTIIPKKRMIVMRVGGEIDHHSAVVIRTELEKELKRTGAVNIAFDFGRVSFMDSAGIGMIIGRYKTVKALGGNVIVYDVAEHMQRLFKMAGLDKLVIMSDSLREGLEVINRKGKGNEQ